MKNKPKVTNEVPQDYLQNFNELGGVSGLDHLRQNLDAITVEQVPELIDAIKAMDRDPSSKDFDEINELMGVVLQGLQDKLPNPESVSEEEALSPELKLVETPADSPEVLAAEERLSHIQEIFEMERGSFDKSTLRKAKKWQHDLMGMEALLGVERTGPLIGQIEKFKIDAENAQEARKVVSVQPSTQRKTATRTAARVSKPSGSARPTSRWGRLKSKIGL